MFVFCGFIGVIKRIKHRSALSRNAASSAKLYHELNLIEKKLEDGIKYQGESLLLLSSC
jgi:hypothetical protein